MKKLKKLCSIIFLSVIIGGVLLFKVYEENKVTHAPNYQVYIYDDGSTTVHVNSIAHVQQKEDGTLIIEGGGKPQEYNYTRRDNARGSNGE